MSSSIAVLLREKVGFISVDIDADLPVVAPMKNREKLKYSEN